MLGGTSSSLPGSSVPAKFGWLRVRFAQSKGEWPGASSTLRERVGGADEGRERDDEVVARDVGRREGRGPVDEMRRELLLMPSLAPEGRAGGGINVDETFPFEDFAVKYDGVGAEAR
jgi:hypothetical protein